MFYQIFLSPQVKRWAIITYKHYIYTSCLTCCRTTYFRRWGVKMPTQEKKNKKDAKKLAHIRKVSKPHKMIAQRPAPPPPHQNHPIKVAICNNCPLLQ